MRTFWIDEDLQAYKTEPDDRDDVIEVVELISHVRLEESYDELKENYKEAIKAVNERGMCIDIYQRKIKQLECELDKVAQREARLIEALEYVVDESESKSVARRIRGAWTNSGALDILCDYFIDKTKMAKRALANYRTELSEGTEK